MRRLEELYLLLTANRRYQNWIHSAEPDFYTHRKGTGIDKGHGRKPSEDLYFRDRSEKEYHDHDTLPRPHFLILQRIKTPEYSLIGRSYLSIFKQVYQDWELGFILLGDHGQEILDEVQGLIEKDDRATCQVCDEVVHLENWILEKVEGKKNTYVIFLEPDGLLAPHALEEFKDVLDENPEADWIYCDEDYMDPKGRRHSPWFKPDWSPELLLSNNYLNPAVIRKEIISNYLQHRQTQDRDEWVESPLYFLDIASAKVHHCPKVLYHRMQSKKWLPSRHVVDPRHQNWVESYLRKSRLVVARPILMSNQELRISFTPRNASVSILIPSKDNVRLLRRCVESILQRTRFAKYELIVIDTGSELEETLHFYQSVSKNPKVKISKIETEFNYSQVNNFGAQITDGEYLLFLNDDIEVLKEGWLEELLGLAQMPGIGIVGARLSFPNGTIQHIGIILGLGGHAGHVFRGVKKALNNPFGSTGWYRNVLAVTGACMLVHREVYNEIGGFDEEYQLVFSDVDFCLKAIEHGYRVVVSPFTELIHHEGASRGRYMPIQDVTFAYERFLPYLHSGDPYYNPNLSYQKTYPRIRSPNEIGREERVLKILERMKHSSGFDKTGDR